MLKAALAGDSFGQYGIGLYYQHGSGVEKDYAEARKWYEKSVRQGNRAAKTNLGILYLEGKGGPKDQSKGAALVKEAAEAGSKHAQYTLAHLYADVEGVPQSDDQAVNWIHNAAENDSALAMDMLAQAYLNGKYGLPKSPVKWDYWQKRAKETRARTHEVDPSIWTIFDWIKYKLSN